MILQVKPTEMVEYLMRVRESLIEAEQRETQEKQRWQDLTTELAAKTAKLEIYKEARTVPDENAMTFSKVWYNDFAGDSQRE